MSTPETDPEVSRLRAIAAIAEIEQQASEALRHAMRIDDEGSMGVAIVQALEALTRAILIEPKLKLGLR